MNKKEIFELINSNPAFHLATVEGNQPRVRGMLLYKADETGIVFHSGTMKDLYSQVKENPKVELCFNSVAEGVQIRFSGELEIVEDKVLKDEIIEHPTRVFLKSWIDSGELEDFYNSFVVFRLKNGVANVWTMETNFDSKQNIKIIS